MAFMRTELSQRPKHRDNSISIIMWSCPNFPLVGILSHLIKDLPPLLNILLQIFPDPAYTFFLYLLLLPLLVEVCFLFTVLKITEYLLRTS